MEVKHKSKVRGFTLIEVVLGLTIISVAIAGVVSILFSFRQSTVDPIFEAKASMLADHVISRLYAVSYDENSDHNGSECRCGEISITGGNNSLKICHDKACTASGSFGPDVTAELNATSPDSFNDVDDYDTQALCEKGGSTIKDLCSTNSEFCTNNKCVIAASFFTTAVFGDWVNDKQSTIEMYDAAYNDFYVYIHVSQNENITNIDGKQYVGILESPTPSPVNSVYAQMKIIDLAIVTPQGTIYKYRMLRGNF